MTTNAKLPVIILNNSVMNAPKRGHRVADWILKKKKKKKKKIATYTLSTGDSMQS